MESGIYKITNPKGKIYVGQSVNIKRRWNEHKYSNCKKLVKLYRSFEKYGCKSHKFEILEICSKELLNEREIYWGKYYNVLNKEKGLNLKLGNGRGNVSEEVKKKLSKSRKGFQFSEKSKQQMRNSALGRNNTEIQKNKLSISLKKYYSKNQGSFKGKKHTEETKNKIRKSIEALKDGVVVEEYSSLKEAGIYHQTHSGNIIKAIKRKGTLHGLVWRYKK